MLWKVVDTGIASAEQNMAVDRQMLQSLSVDPQPIIHFYDWVADSATYGYFINPNDFINPQASLSLAKRPTGGGVVFHLWDLAYSVLVPALHSSFSVNTLDNYAFINRGVALALQQWRGVLSELLPIEPVPLDKACTHFCMAKPTQYDVMVNGKKVGGGAQRRTRYGYLHQGTISLVTPDIEYLKKIFLPGNRLVEAIGLNTYPLLADSHSKQQIQKAKKEIKHHLATALSSSNI